MIDILVHPVRRDFDRAEAFGAAVAEMPGTIERLRDHVEREFARAVVGRVRRGLDDEDVTAFWGRAREAAAIFTA